jgi:hypothetical protein
VDRISGAVAVAAGGGLELGAAAPGTKGMEEGFRLHTWPVLLARTGRGG